MKYTLALPTRDDAGLEGAVGPHFGRSPRFVLVDIEAENQHLLSHRSIENPNVLAHQPGRAPRLMREHGVAIVIARRLGSRASSTLTQLGIDVRQAPSSKTTIREAVHRYLRGELPALEGQSCHERHHHDRQEENDGGDDRQRQHRAGCRCGQRR